MITLLKTFQPIDTLITLQLMVDNPAVKKEDMIKDEFAAAKQDITDFLTSIDNPDQTGAVDKAIHLHNALKGQLGNLYGYKHLIAKTLIAQLAQQMGQDVTDVESTVSKLRIDDTLINFEPFQSAVKPVICMGITERDEFSPQVAGKQIYQATVAERKLKDFKPTEETINTKKTGDITYLKNEGKFKHKEEEVRDLIHKNVSKQKRLNKEIKDLNAQIKAITKKIEELKDEASDIDGKLQASKSKDSPVTAAIEAFKCRVSH